MCDSDHVSKLISLEIGVARLTPTKLLLVCLLLGSSPTELLSEMSARKHDGKEPSEEAEYRNEGVLIEPFHVTRLMKLTWREGRIISEAVTFTLSPLNHLVVPPKFRRNYLNHFN